MLAEQVITKKNEMKAQILSVIVLQKELFEAHTGLVVRDINIDFVVDVSINGDKKYLINGIDIDLCL